MNNPFLKRLMKDKTEDVLHTSAYGEAQNSGKMGVTSSESFSTRLTIDKNRSRIKAYNDSRIVNDARGNMPRPKTYEVGEKNIENVAQSVGDTGSQTIGQGGIQPRRGSPSNSPYSSKLSLSSSRSTGSQAKNNPPARKNPGIFR